MVIRTRHGGNLMLRTAPEFGASAIPLPGGGLTGYSGKAVTVDRAAGLPAVGSVIRQACAAVAMCDLDVYKRTGDDDLPGKPVASSWQADLFDNPTLDDSEFDFLSDLAAGVEGYGNSFFVKTKKGGRVLELQPLPPDYVAVRRDNGRKVFDVAMPDGNGRYRLTRGVGTDQILHIPGFRWPGLLSGLSPILMHRVALDRSLSVEEYAGRFFQNDASPPYFIAVPGKLGRTQAKEMMDIWESTHGGLANAHRPGLLTNGATANPLGISMRDAQYIEGENLTTSQVAQIWNWPVDLLQGGDTGATQRLSVEQLGLRLLTFCVASRLRRIEKALEADQDLFPARSGLCPMFTTHRLVQLDALTLSNVLHLQVQDGTLSKNEARAKLGMPPREGGDTYQDTPVGGAPNGAPPPDPGGTKESP